MWKSSTCETIIVSILKDYLQEPLQDLTKSLLLGRFLDQLGLAQGER